jgi:raffinose/stachyose/melibiose transport system substrate-binding protein
MKLKKILTVILAFGIVLAGCSTKSGSSTPSVAESAAAPAATEAPAKMVELKMWSFEGKDPQKSVIQKSVDDFNASHKNIKITPEYYDDEAFKAKIKVSLAGNDMPDIYTYWAGAQFKTLVDGSAVGDITDNLAADADFKNSVLPGGLEAFAYSGKNYGIPVAMNAVLLWYNKEILQNNGITPPKTYEELLAAVDKLNAAKVIPIAVAGKDRWPVLHWFSYFSNRVGTSVPFDSAAAGKGDFLDPSFITAGEKLNELGFKHKGFENGFLGLDYGAAEALFTSGKAAFYQQGDWAVAGFTKDDTFAAKVGFVSFPTVAGGQGDIGTFQGGYGFGYAISGKADKNAAYEAIKYLSGPGARTKIAELTGSVIPFKDVKLNKDNMKPLAYEVSTYVSANAKGFFPYYDQALDPKRTEAVLNVTVAIAGKEKVDIKEELAKIK